MSYVRPKLPTGSPNESGCDFAASAWPDKNIKRTGAQMGTAPLFAPPQGEQSPLQALASIRLRALDLYFWWLETGRLQESFKYRRSLERRFQQVMGAELGKIK